MHPSSPSIRSLDPLDRQPVRQADLGPVRITNVSRPEALHLMDVAAHSRSSHFYCFCEANLLSNALKSEPLRQALAKADAIFPDGIALMALARLLGTSLVERITGPAFMLHACEYGLTRNWRHFFYGGAPGVADRLAEKLSRQFPGLQVAGTWCPPFRSLSADEEIKVKRVIEDAQPHLLWVGLGSPKQEFWIADHLDKINVPVMLAVGAAFDFHSGNRAWAPPFIRQIGMEWAYRALTGGRKTFARNVRCVARVGAHLTRVALQGQP
jgi:N-acetylglucosaminyldiphosphoundecaprenol N-acetyl-beta-D-mannosaminyltransferase